MKILYFISLVKRNYIVRFLLIPLYYVVKCIDTFFYQFSDDSRYVKSLQNKHIGKRCFIIGNGPSLTSQDLDLLKGEIAFGSNKIYAMYDRTKWRPTYYICGDPYLVVELKDEIKSLSGSIKFIANSKGRKKIDHQYGIHHLMVEPKFGIKQENYVQRGINTNIHKHISKTQTVTCTAIEMAIYMGIKEIYLLGVDHTFAVEVLKDGTKVYHTGVKNHFEGGESSLQTISKIPAPIEVSTQCYQVCQDYAIAHGIKIYNCTRGGKLEVFERKKLEAAIGERGM